jgi:hypothetical protein
MKKIFLILIMGMVVMGSLFTIQVSAQTPTNSNEYTVLAPLPGVGDKGGTTTLQDYVPAIFKLAIGLSAAFAVLMIVIGGFQYMSTDAIMKKENGKKRIQNAVFGLVLVIGAWLILYTINPNLLTLNLDIKAVSTTGTGGGTLGGGNVLPGYTMTPAQIADSQATKDKLYNDSGGKITTNSVDPCLTGQTAGCTNLNDLPANAIAGIEQLQKNCNCNLLITGGTEGGHLSHGPGQPNLDLSPSSALGQYIIGKSSASTQTSLGQQYTVDVNGVKATFLEESNPPHWHVVFK